MASNEEFYDELVIRSSDYILSHMENAIEYTTEYLIQFVVINRIEPNISKEKEELFNSKYKERIWNFLFSKGYIERLPYSAGNDFNSIYCKITDVGKIVKKRGGHCAYLDYEKKFDKVPFQTLRWAKVAGITGIIVLALGLWSEFKGCDFSKNQPQITIKIKPKDSAKFDSGK